MRRIWPQSVAMASSLSPRRQTALQETFAKLDRNKSGKLPIDNFGILVRASLNVTPTEAWIRQRIGTRSEFSLSDCYGMMETATSPPDTYTKEEIHSALKFFDKRGDGTLSPRTLRYVLSGIGEPLPMEWTNNMIRTVPKQENTGNIRISDFLRIIYKCLFFALICAHSRCPSNWTTLTALSMNIAPDWLWVLTYRMYTSYYPLGASRTVWN